MDIHISTYKLYLNIYFKKPGGRNHVMQQSNEPAISSKEVPHVTLVLFFICVYVFMVKCSYYLLQRKAIRAIP